VSISISIPYDITIDSSATFIASEFIGLVDKRKFFNNLEKLIILSVVKLLTNDAFIFDEFYTYFS